MTVRFWKDGEKFTERELDSYWNGREEEQDRIIKLLDGWHCGHPNCDADKTEVCYPKHYLISKIKGETK